MVQTLVRSFSVRVFRTPLKRAFVTALGRKTETCNVGFSLTLRDGTVGYGEASASLALAHLKPQRLAKVLGDMGRWAMGQDAAAHRPLIEEAWKKHSDASPAVSAFECALLDAWTRSQGLCLASWFGGKLSEIESDVTISAWDDPAMTSQAAGEAAQDGFRLFKIKVGTTYTEDLSRIKTVHAAARGRAYILDGNQGLTVSSSLRLIEACLKSGIQVELLEQPLPKTDFKGMAALTRRSPIPVAADEMVFSPQDAVRVAREGAASVINIKVAKSGLLRALEIAAVARASGLRLMIGCMAETSQGLMPSVHLAMGAGSFDFVDLDSDYLLRDQGLSKDWRRRGPILSRR